MKNKKNNNEQDSLDFDFIFNNDVNQESIDNKLKDIKKRNTTIVICLIALILCSIFLYNIIQETNKDYVDGNVLKIAASGSSTEFYDLANPWKNASFIGSLLYRPLFLTDSSFTEIRPELAQSHTVSNDGLTYTVTMKENIKWSDGTNITVDDVIFSIESFLLCSDVNVNIDTAFQKIVGSDDFKTGKTSSLEGLSAEGNVLTIKLSSKYNTFAMMLTQFVPLPKHILQDQSPETLTQKHQFFVNETPITSGRFMPEGVVDGNIVLIHNPHYDGVQTEIEKVIAYMDWENMDIDYFTTTNITQMVTFRNLKQYTEFDVDVFFYRYFVFNNDGSDAVKDVKVRQAVNHAIDIEKLFKDYYLNAGSLVYGGASDIADEKYEYNPTKALQLLQEAGYDFDHTFQIAYYYSDATSRLFLEKVAEYLEAIGMKVELVRLSSAELYKDPTYDMMLKGLSAFNSEDWYNEYLSINENMSALMGNKGEFDDLVNSMTSAVTVEEFRGYMNQLVEKEQDLLYKMPLFTLNQCVYINTDRLSIPEDMTFGNTRYQSSINLDEWTIKKS